MKLGDLGERAVIERLASFLEIGDDAAYIPWSDGFIVLSTDMIYEKTHIPPIMTPEQVGRFIVSVNASDIASMGARPVAFLMSCGLPDMEVSRFEKIIRSAKTQCEAYGMKYVGGDTKPNEGLTLAGFCVGAVEKPVLRSGAREGDVLAVTGRLGDAPLGFDMMANDLDHPLRDAIVKEALEPVARVREGMILQKYATSMTDISDSLAVSIHDLTQGSKLGARISLQDIPVSESFSRITQELGFKRDDYLLYQGGDYELLFTISPEDYEKIKQGLEITRIGEITGERGVQLVDAGESGLEKKGFNHFINSIK